MEDGNIDKDVAADDAALERSSLCISSDMPGITLHSSDKGFAVTIGRHYTSPEAQANEKLCRLKARLPGLSTDDFWTTLMEGITEVTGSQYALAVRRLLPADQDLAVEMPEVGDPGQCLMATAFFYNDGVIHRNHVRDYKFYPYSGPCSHMKHDKVFVVPSELARFIGDQINRFAFPVDAYIGMPLFSSMGECIGHFGALWSEDGMKNRDLSWGFVEMALHSLEDIVAKRLTEGQVFSQRAAATAPDQVIPAAVVNAAQSLKPYARSLSHELRTPMQGVVGMLDIMHASVLEALETPMRADLARTFKMLRENIEVVQDSSRRAVEAADNVVHAADLDMQVPETPDPPDVRDGKQHEADDYMSAGKVAQGTASGGRKRKREDEASHAAKHVATETSSVPQRPLTPRTAVVRSAVQESGSITGVVRPSIGDPTPSDMELSQTIVTTSTKVTRIREHIRTVVSECLRYGGRPESAIAEDTDLGEAIEVRTRDGKGQITNKWVEWSIDPAVPDEIQVDERDFTKLISVLLLNALKFTTHGRIRLLAHLGSSSRLLVVNVVDTGTGIPAEFMPNLFKAFSRQDDTITRQSEGLGLGLLVAKGVARKLGGDLRCVRSETEGPGQGSEFEVRVPLSPSEASSRHASPSRTPTPSHPEDAVAGLAMRRSTSTRSIKDAERDSSTSPTIPDSPRKSSKQQQQQTFFPLRREITPPRAIDPTKLRRGSGMRPSSFEFDRQLAKKYPLRFLVAEDNRLNRKLLVTMLGKFGYTAIYEAFDGAEAVRLMEVGYGGDHKGGKVDVILMDLWMPNMDGYEATRRILDMQSRLGKGDKKSKAVKILAVTADVTDGALDRAKEAGMTGFMTKPYKMMDLERLIMEHCAASG